MNRLSIFRSLFLFGLMLLVTLALFKPELPRTHDMEFHAARVTNYYFGLKAGHWPPRWAPNLNYGFGYPLFEFMYPLPYFGAAVGYAVFSQVELALNALVIFSVATGVIGMWLLSYRLTKSDWVAAAATTAYVTAPYSLLNLYVRGAIGEVVFFGVLPWLLLVVESLKSKKVERWWLVAPIVIAASLLAHHLSVIIIVPVLVGWWLVSQPPKRWLSGWWLVIPGGLLSSFFWIPLLFEKHLTKIDTHNTVADFWYHFPPFHWLLWSPWQYGGFSEGVVDEQFSTMVGVGLWLILGLTAWVWWNHKTKKGSSLVLFWLVITFLSLFLMTRPSRFVWEVFEPLQFIQFPWRLLWLAVTSMLLAWMWSVKAGWWSRQWQKEISGIVILLGLAQALWWAQPAGYFSSDDITWREYQATASAYDELLPKQFDGHKNLKLTERVVIRPEGARVFETERQEQPTQVGSVEILQWSGFEMSYVVDVPVEQAAIIHKTAAWPGWQVEVDGEPVAVEAADYEFPGRVVFPVSQGRHEVSVKLTQATFPRKLGDSLSVMGGLVLLLASGWVARLLLKKIKNV